LLVVDTNVVVSGLLTHDVDTPPAQILDRMLAGAIWFVVSPELLAECRAVLLRPRIAGRHRLAASEIDLLLVELTRNAVIREPVPPAEAPPDRNDAHLWALLEAEPASILVTGDRTLLGHPPPGRSVVSPAAALELLDR
jgi:putative PIN family toxin of toxin-antitoxin system